MIKICHIFVYYKCFFSESNRASYWLHRFNEKVKLFKILDKEIFWMNGNFYGCPCV